MRRVIVIAAATLATVASLYAQTEYAAIAALRNAARSSVYLRSDADGEHYTLRAGNSILRRAYADRTQESVVVSADFPIADYALSPDGGHVVYADRRSVSPIYRHSFTADYWLYDGKTSQKILSGVRDVSFSPDNTHIAFAQGNNLNLYNMADGSTTAITDDGCWNAVINGTSDWVYEEEYGFTKAYTFSPDGGQIAYLRFDESRVPTFEMMRYDQKLYNHAYSFKYPKAGDANSSVELWLYDIAHHSRTKVDTGEECDCYIPHLGWTPAGELYFYRVNRLQNRFEVFLLRNGAVERIYNEESPRYVERPNASTVTFIDGERFVVREETTTGYMHLYLHSIRRGRLHAITSGEWEVTSLIAADRKGVCYISTERSPLRRDVWQASLDGRHRRRQSKGDGFYGVAPSCGMKYYIQTFNSSTTPDIVTVHRGDGQTVDTLVDCRAAAAAHVSLPQRHFDTFTTERGDTLNYYIELPADFDASKRYPVLITQYSGPGSQQVRDRWSADWEDALPSHGIIVACCDGRGTGFRGEAFKKATYGDLGRIETEDQLSFARMLAALPYTDEERIGIYGWSYGGFMALNCALHGEGLFRMAIAVAPVTSWRYYDTIYTEIYNGLPQDNPRGYDDNSPITHAAKLSPRTRLLIIHGTADDNVHFQNSMEMCRALNRAGKQYDMMVYPDQNHSMLPSCTGNIRQKMIDYTVANLF